MFILELIIGIFLLGSFLHFRYSKRKHEELDLLINQHIDSSEEMKKTLTMGLYFRFKRETEENLVKYSRIYLKGDPITFETFVAEIIQSSRGGSVWVSPSSNDQGIDFEHTTSAGLYLGQVKCYEGDLSY